MSSLRGRGRHSSDELRHFDLGQTNESQGGEVRGFWIGLQTPVFDGHRYRHHRHVNILAVKNANYFHTHWQPVDWPDKGLEVQVDNSHSDPKRTAGLYDVKDVYEVVVPAR
jgi:hypothetical protein